MLSMDQFAGIGQGVLGIGQMIGGLLMPKPDIPDYEIPQELYENMTDAEYWSFVGLPEAQKQQFIEGSARAGASALSQSASRKGGLGLVSSVAQQQQDSNKQLLSMDAQARMQNIRQHWSARERMAQAKDVKFGHDMDKVMYQLQKRDQMIGAGMQNLGGSFSTFAGSSVDQNFGGTYGQTASYGGGGSFDQTMQAKHNNVPTSNSLMSSQPSMSSFNIGGGSF
jgi:predicted transposase YbfD/YdcC